MLVTLRIIQRVKLTVDHGLCSKCIKKIMVKKVLVKSFFNIIFFNYILILRLDIVSCQ